MWRGKLVLSAVLVASIAALAVGCGEDGTEPTVPAAEEETFVVPPGKMDNFYSLSAQEYLVEGEATVTLDDSDLNLDPDALDARVKELILYNQIAINWFLLQYLTGPEDEHENKYESLTKNGSYEELDIRVDPNDPHIYTFHFQQEIGGQLDLLEALPTTKLPDGTLTFPLPVGIVSNSQLARLDINREWYRSAPWTEFDPTKVDASKVKYMDLTIKAEPRSSDAWIDYNRLFEDGVVDIGVHWGWDYHSEYHLVHSKDTYNWLVERQGFKSPVDSYDDYTRTSGPLTRTIEANGKPIEVRVSLFWGKPGTDTDPDTSAGGRVLEDDMRESFRSRDVVVFSGHSGPFYGYALANWRKTDEGDLDDSKIAGMDMPSKYQVVLSEGCDTYALGEAFWQNPAKMGQDNLDVITTTNFSNASTAGVVQNFLRAIFDVEGGSQKPWKYSDLLGKLDGNSYWFHSMYGVHGIDDNPKVHPYGVLDNLCEACSVDADCGGFGNKCVKLLNDDKACSVECVDSSGCPDGYECLSVASGSWIRSKQCIPSTYDCADIEAGPTQSLMINEVLADPPMGDAGDANGDGVRETFGDEFVELLNIGSDTVNLGGWSLADASVTRLVFPADVSVKPGQSVVVFGGGDPEMFKDFQTELDVVIVTADRLVLNNSGDTVTLSRPNGDVEDAMSYGREGGNDHSLVRATDGDPKAAFVEHTNGPFSPGTTQQGLPFM